MSAEITDIIIPSICFFIAFFLGFLLVETLIILMLNRLMFHYWGFTVNVLMKSQQLYGKKIRMLTLAAVIILIALLLKFTALLSILRIATLEIKILAAETLLAMTLIYLTTTRQLPKLEVEKAIHKYLYIYLSVIVFTLTIIAADKSYADYKDFINANVTATVGNVEKKLEQKKKDALLTEFRAQIYNGQCQEVNYIDEVRSAVGIKHFIFVATHPDLKRAATDFEDDPSAEKYFRGRACTNGIETFLLTEHGRWYWVINS
ncbi:MAG: hypothetical protein V1760_01945 [Candidatus Peregrinibacteria bacterium]